MFNDFEMVVVASVTGILADAKLSGRDHLLRSEICFAFETKHPTLFRSGMHRFSEFAAEAAKALSAKWDDTVRGEYKVVF